MPIGAAIGAAGIGAAGSIYAANTAAGAAKDAASQDNALQKYIYDQNTKNLTPFMDRGNAAGDELSGLLGLGDTAAATKAFDTFRNSTNYNWALSQNLGAVNQNFAARGGLNSGAAAKALQDRGQQVALGSLNGYIGDLQTQQGVGLQGASALAGVGQNYAGAVGANNNSAASATGNAALYSSNSINGLINSALTGYGASSYGGGSNTGNSNNLSAGLGYLQGITQPDAALGAY